MNVELNSLNLHRSMSSLKNLRKTFASCCSALEHTAEENEKRKWVKLSRSCSEKKFKLFSLAFLLIYIRDGEITKGKRDEQHSKAIRMI
jgi:hypothetical protein